MPSASVTKNPAVRLLHGPGKVLHEENSRTALTMESRKLPQFLAAFAATLGALCAGTFFAWTSAVGKLPIDETLSSWVGSVITLGAFAGCMVAGIMANRLGRQRTLLLMALPMLVAWGMLSVASSGVCLLLGRVLAGLAIGVVSVAAGMYVSEVAEASVRGTLGSFFQLQITVGILLGYLTGLLHNPAHLAYVCAALPVLYAALLWRMPESPVFLLSRGQSSAARESLQWLRGSEYDVSVEITTIRHSILQSSEQGNASVKDLFSTRAASRGMVIALGLMASQQLSGINAVIFYANKIFNNPGSPLGEEACTIAVGVVQVASTFVSMLLADAAGRRVLLLLSSGVMTVCLATLGVYFHLFEAHHDMEGVTWLPLVAVAVFIVMFALGLGPLPWCVVSEIFSPSIKGAASSVACGANWFMAFLVTQLFPVMIKQIGLSVAFFVFSSIAALGTVFIALMVPETKGKSLEEILDELAGVKSHAAAEADVGSIEEDEDNNRKPFPL